MEEMIYEKYRTIKLLYTDKYKNYWFYILSLGTHPTAYIEIKKDSKFYKKEYEQININVHGGLTYSDNYLYLSKNTKINGWFIGWDYAHYGDYLGYEENYPKEYKSEEKKWTTEEIKRECEEAIEELIELEKNNDKQKI